MVYAISRLLLIALVVLLGLAHDTRAEDWSADSGFSIGSPDDLDVDEVSQKERLASRPSSTWTKDA